MPATAVPTATVPWFAAFSQLCGEVTRGVVRPPKADPQGGVFSWLRRLFTKTTPACEIERHRAELAADPRNPIALWRLARFLDRYGCADLCAVVLSALHKVRPDDSAPAAALARCFLARARRSDRGLADRLKDYDRFVRYCDRALSAREDDELRDLRTVAAVEVTFLKGQYDA